jgi:hypothetical protein
MSIGYTLNVFYLNLKKIHKTYFKFLLQMEKNIVPFIMFVECIVICFVIEENEFEQFHEWPC